MGEFIAEHWDCMLVYIIGGLIGSAIMDWLRSRWRAGIVRVRKEAVEAGVAEWVVTGSNGETEFRWKEVGSDERK